MPLNKYQILNALTADTFKTVSCVFTETKYAPGHEKAYTYKVPHVMTPEADDLAIVPTVRGYSVCRITEVHETPQIDPDATYEYKFVVAIVNPAPYEAMMQKQEELLKEIEKDMKSKKFSELKDVAESQLTAEGIAKIKRL